MAAPTSPPDPVTRAAALCGGAGDDVAASGSHPAAMATQLPLPINPEDAVRRIIFPALRLLPPAMTSLQAVVLIVAIFLQESALAHRWQVVDAKRPERKGPARGLAQFEKGTRASRGGVWGIYLHASSRYWLSKVCEALGIPFTPDAIWQAMERSDVLAAACARLLLFTDPKPLPAPDDEEGAWKLYLRTWRPGAYTRGTPTARRQLREKFGRNHRVARAAALAARP